VLKKYSSYQLATIIALFFHCVGIAGILFIDRELFIKATPLNLLLSFALLVYTQQQKNGPFFIFMVVVMIAGFLSEVIGVNTGLLFGEYAYGRPLGIQLWKVPLMIGVNWFIIIYCCGISTHTLLLKIVRGSAVSEHATPGLLKAVAVVVDGATLAVAFDWLMEPVAVKLGYWAWQNGDIPAYNYICWFLISLLFLGLFHFFRFDKGNKFAVNLLLIQAMFFLLLATFLD